MFALRLAALTLVASFSLALGARPVAAAEPPLTRFAGVAISPDGRFVADVESIASADETREPPQRLFVRNVADGSAREVALPCASLDGCAVTLPAWSHDSTSIAYVVHAPKRATRDIVVAKVGSGPIVPVRILEFAGTFDGLTFSRDDRSLAGLAIPNARKEVGATQAGAAIVGEIGAAPDEQRIAVLALASPRVSYASPPNLFVYEFDWLSAGRFVATAAPGDGDDNWWVAKLYEFEPATMSVNVLYSPSSPQQQLASPRVSADGRYVAFIGGIMSDFGSTGGDLFTLALGTAGAAPVDLTPNAPSTTTSFEWTCAGDDLIFTRLHGANSEIAMAAANAATDAHAIDSTPENLSAGDAAVSRACESPHSALRLAAVRQTFEIAPEIYIGAGGANGLPWAALTHENKNVPSEARARSLTWSSDGFVVQGWLLEPPAAPASGRLGLVTDVHGGPAAANVPRFVGRGGIRDLLRHGYAVFLPNPRGSFGQGEAFTMANVKDFGYGDLRDILAGVDEAERQDPAIDDARLGIEGGSYGGYMTMWAVTQTQRFKAAVADAGVSDWLSYYGENGIDEWMIPYFGASVYDDPNVYAKSSPIDFIKRVKTPTFEFVGERDVECPAPQSLEFWHALVAVGVPTSLVIYPGEGHHIRSARNVADVTKRTLSWFDRYLAPSQ